MPKSYRKEIHGIEPYYDDYDSQKKFVRILSRPGFPLQAREVTQLQTILQEQIERLGDHLFADGASVRGGEITEATAYAIRLSNTSYTTDELNSFVNKIISNQNGVKARVIAYADGSDVLPNDQYQVFFVNYITAGAFNGGDTISIEATLPLEQFSIITGTQAITIASNVVCINKGIFYADGFFVENDSQSFVAYNNGGTYRNFENPTSSIGFKVVRDVITSGEDETLKDPSFGFYNFNSPGADRYRIRLVLTQIELSDANSIIDSDDYIELIRVVNGQTTKKVRYTDYAIFEDTLARRTFDESGNYTVRPFEIIPVAYSTAFGSSSTSTTQHGIKIGAGKAYILGYEFETIAPTYFAIDRALTKQKLYRQTLSMPLTNYVSVLRSSSYDSTYDGDRATYSQNKKGIIQRVDGQTVTNLGTCNIRTIEEVDGELRLYLFNVSMTATGEGNGFAYSTHIAVDDGSPSDNTQRYRIGTTDTDTEIKGVGSSRQIFRAPVGSALIRASGSDGLFSSFLVKKPYQFEIASGSDSATITSNKNFLEGTPRNHVVFLTDSTSTGATAMKIGEDVIIYTSNNQTTSTLTIEIPEGSGITTGVGGLKGTIIASQIWSSDGSSNIRTKTLVNGTVSGITGNPETGIVNLGHADVYSIIEVNDSTRSVTDSFDLDVNSTVDCYRRSRLVLRAGATCGLDENGDLLIDSVSYKYFSHSGDGPFTVDSYPLTSDFVYDDIPTFTDPETGESYSLSDAFDFRPSPIDGLESGFNNGSGGSQVVAFDNGVILSTVSYEHYLSRIDRVVLSQNRGFKIVKGIPSVNPKSPEVEQNDMILGDLLVSPYTRTEDDIRFRYIDNQRTTMAEINEQEKAQQFDQFFIFKNDLEQEALNRAQNFRSSRTALADGVFVDTFIGHNNAVTVKRDHNCSIDPEYGELRPAFESQFYSMGTSGANLGGDLVLSSDGVYHLTSSDSIYSGNTLASNTISANQFSVPDFLGTLNLTPSSDNYFSVVKKPRVIVNTVGEVDNWEQAINAYQRGRTRGFGSQWRDWETLWFGSRKRNDINIEHETNGTEYTVSRRSSFVSRVISDKVIKKIGNKIVDLSVVPYVRSRTISFTARNLKPFTNHTVYFDGVVQTNVTTDVNGAASGTFTIASQRYLTGEKLVRLVDRTDGLALATSSADAIYYAQGLLNTKEGDVYSIRPPITRRKASNVEDVSTDYYVANAKDNLSPTYNSQTPFAQQITVDPSAFPNGIMLKSVELFFAKKPTEQTVPVKVAIRPMFNGAPHPFKVVPFSEKTLNWSEITVSSAEATTGGGTTFTFGTPVYLKPNTSYAICITTNASDYLLWYGAFGAKAIEGDYGQTTETNTTIVKPRYMESLHDPSNNGSAYETTDSYLKMNVVKCAFASSTQAARTLVLSTSAPSTRPYHVLYTHGNEQVTDTVKPSYTLKSKNYNGGEEARLIDLNTTINDFATKKIIDDSGSQSSTRIEAEFVIDSTGSVCSLIDSERIGCLAVEYMANNDDPAAQIEESQPSSRLATNRSRYISRKISLNRAADDIVVIVDGSYVGDSQIKVYVKLQGPDQPNGVFDDNNWEELYPEGDIGSVSVSARFAELKPNGPRGGIMRFTTNSISPGTSTDFVAYQIKVLLMGQNVTNEGNSTQIPIIYSLSAVPLRRTSQDEVRRYIPAGTVMSWAGGGNAPFGFVYCNGAEYDYVENPEYRILFDAIGYTYGGSGNTFKVPDLRARTIIGRNDTAIPSWVGGDNSFDRSVRYLGQYGGRETVVLQKDEIPPHSHVLGRKIELIRGFNNGQPAGTNIPQNDQFMFASVRLVQESGGDDNASFSFQARNGDGYGNNNAITKYHAEAVGTPPSNDPTSMAGHSHPNMVPYQVLDYIIKI